MDREHNYSLLTRSVDDDAHLATGETLRLAHPASLRTAPGRGYLVDFVSAHAGCAYTDDLCTELDFFPAQPGGQRRLSHHGTAGSPLAAAGTAVKLSRRADDDIVAYRWATAFIVLGATLYYGP